MRLVLLGVLFNASGVFGQQRTAPNPYASEVAAAYNEFCPVCVDICGTPDFPSTAPAMVQAVVQDALVRTVHIPDALAMLML